MKERKKQISITLDRKMAEQLKELARQDDRSLSQYIRWLLRCGLETQSKK